MGDQPEMTDAMMDAGQKYLDGISLRGHYLMPATFNWHEFYRVLLAASPPSPTLPSREAIEATLRGTEFSGRMGMSKADRATAASAILALFTPPEPAPKPSLATVEVVEWK